MKMRLLASAFVAGLATVTNAGSNLRLDRNEAVSLTQPALQISNSVGGVLVRANTFVKCATAVAAQGTTPSAISVRDNIFVEGSGCALTGPSPATYSDTTPNLFFANGGTGCVEDPAAAGNVSADPLFIGGAVGNFRLLSQSPAIDSGADLGLELNGASPGLFFGAAPDLGAHESSY